MEFMTMNEMFTFVFCILMVALFCFYMDYQQREYSKLHTLYADSLKDKRALKSELTDAERELWNLKVSINRLGRERDEGIHK